MKNYYINSKQFEDSAIKHKMQNSTAEELGYCLTLLCNWLHYVNCTIIDRFPCSYSEALADPELSHGFAEVIPRFLVQSRLSGFIDTNLDLTMFHSWFLVGGLLDWLLWYVVYTFTESLWWQVHTPLLLWLSMDYSDG